MCPGAGPGAAERLCPQPLPRGPQGGVQPLEGGDQAELGQGGVRGLEGLPGYHGHLQHSHVQCLTYYFYVVTSDLCV